MESEMVLTRQQTQALGGLSPTGSTHDSQQNDNKSKIVHTDDQLNTQSSTQYTHLSMGDQRHHNVTQSSTISNLEGKVDNLEKSLLHVTQELTNALKTLS